MNRMMRAPVSCAYSSVANGSVLSIQTMFGPRLPLVKHWREKPGRETDRQRRNFVVAPLHTSAEVYPAHESALLGEGRAFTEPSESRISRQQLTRPQGGGVDLHQVQRAYPPGC